MKRNIILSIFITCMVVFSNCGGGSDNYKNNDVLGKFPSAYVVYNAEIKELTDNMREKGGRMKSPSDFEKLRSEWEKKENAVEERRDKVATEAFEKINGSGVPFKILSEDENFSIESVTITDAAINTGALTLSVKVKAKQDLTANTNGDIYYFIINDKDEIFNSGSLDPYARNQIRRAERPELRAGELCNIDGSNLMLYCNSYDYTDFKKIWFVNWNDFNSVK